MINGISVVICCYNSEARLPQVLKHFEAQDVDKEILWEILIVDNASTDRTAAVSKELWTREDVILRVVHEAEAGLSFARLRGIKESIYNVISFIDDDNWVESAWIQKVYTIMSADDNIGMLGGRGIAAFEAEPPFWFNEFEGAYAVGSGGKKTGKQSSSLIRGAGMNIRRESWNYLIDNQFEFILSGRKGKNLSSGEDVEMCSAFLLSGIDLYYDDDLLFYHYMPEFRLSWKYMINLSAAFGRAAPVENLYAGLLEDTGFNLLKKTNIYLSIMRTTFHYVRALLRFIPSICSTREGNRKYSNIIYFKHGILERFRLIHVFPSYVSKITQSQWYTNKLRS